MKHTKYWPYLKWSARIFWGLFILFVIIINLTGCTKEIIIERNNTIYKNNTIIKEVFIDRPCNCSNETVYIGDNCLPLIKQIKRLESIIDKWAIADINITINNETVNVTNSTGGE